MRSILLIYTYMDFGILHFTDFQRCSRIHQSMGGLISKPVNYVKTKIDNTKKAINTRIENTKNSIWNFGYGIKTGVVTRVKNTRDGICNTVSGVKNSIVNTVTDTKNAIFGTIGRVRDTIVGGVTNTKDGITRKVRSVKSGVNTKLTAASNWSKKRKVFYILFGFLFLALFIPLSFISWDLYHGRYAEAQQKWQGMERFGSGTLYYSQKAAVKTFHAAETVCYYTALYTEKLCVILLNVAEWLSENVFYGIIEGSIHLWRMTSVGAQYLYIGSCKAGNVILDGTKYAGENIASGGEALGKGLYHGALTFGTWSCEAAGLAYHWTIVTFSTFADWMRVFGALIFEWLLYLTYVFVHYGGIFFHFAYVILYTIFSNVYLVLAILSDFIYRWSGISFPFIVRWLYKLVIFMGEWVATTIPMVTKWVYVAVNRHALHWVWVCLQYLLDYACVAFLITGKFVQDLALYVGNFIFLAGQHILNVLYILYSFLYNILIILTGTFKGGLQGIVSVVKSMFGAIIWFLQETIVAYLYMLHKYNVYRELLFLAFIILVSMYCTGLIRNHKDDTLAGGRSGSPRKKKKKSQEVATVQGEQAAAVTATPPPVYTRSSLMPDAEDSDLDESDLDIDLPDSVPDPMDVDFDTDYELSDLDEPDVLKEEVNEEDLPSEEFPDFSDEDKETEEEGPGLLERIQNIRFRREEGRVENLVPDIVEDQKEIEEEDLIPRVTVSRNKEAAETLDDNGSRSDDEFELPVTQRTMDELEPRSREISRSPAEFALPEITSSDENRDSSSSPLEFGLPDNIENNDLNHERDHS